MEDNKIKAREIMKNMFTDIKTVTNRDKYLNNKSNEIIKEKEKLGYKSGRLDLRNFENFYNESAKKTQIEVEGLFEFFLNFINSTSVALVEEKILFFEKMLYIFFSKTDEQLNFMKFYQKRFEEKNITETLKKLNLSKDIFNTEEENKNNEEKLLGLDIEKNKKEMELFFKKIDEIKETSILKAELMIFEKIQETEKEIKKINFKIEYEEMYEIEENLETNKKEIQDLTQKKEFLENKLKEYEELLKSNFFEKESVFLFLETVLLGLDKVFDKKESSIKDIEISKNNGTNYENLLKLFKEILSYSEFDVEKLNEIEFLEFLQKNKIKLIEIFSIILTEILENVKKNKIKINIEDMLLINNFTNTEAEEIENYFIEGLLIDRTINEEKLLDRIESEFTEIYKNFFEKTTDFLESLNIFYNKLEYTLANNLKKSLNEILGINNPETVKENLQILETFFQFKNKVFFNENELYEFEKNIKDLIRIGVLKEIDGTENTSYSFINEKIINFNELIYKHKELEENNNFLKEQDIQEFLNKKAVFFRKLKADVLVRYIHLNTVISNFTNKHIFYFPKSIVEKIRKKIDENLEKLENLFSCFSNIDFIYSFIVIDEKTIRLKNKIGIKQIIKDLNDVKRLLLRKEKNHKDSSKKTYRLGNYRKILSKKNVENFIKYNIENKHKNKLSNPVKYFSNNYNKILKYTINDLKNNVSLTKKFDYVKNNNIEIQLNITDNILDNEIESIVSINKTLFNNSLEEIVENIYKKNEFEFNSNKKMASFVLNSILFNKNDFDLSDNIKDNSELLKELKLKFFNKKEDFKNNYNEILGADDLKIILHYLKK